MCKKMYYMAIIFLSIKFITLTASSAASETNIGVAAAEPSEKYTTQKWLESKLIKSGKLKEGQHLKPHQAWRIVDQLDKNLKDRQLFKIIEDNRAVLISEGIPQQTITKVLNGLYHSKTRSFDRIIEVLKRNNVDLTLKGFYEYASADSLVAIKTTPGSTETRGAQAATASDDAAHSTLAAKSALPY